MDHDMIQSEIGILSEVHFKKAFALLIQANLEDVVLANKFSDLFVKEPCYNHFLRPSKLILTLWVFIM
jgi:hypothetical protein